MNYYHALRASTAGLTQNDLSKLVRMVNEADFEFCPFTREDLVMCVK